MNLWCAISFVFFAGAFCTEASAQVAPVIWTAQERTFLLQMCEAATYANRMQFDGSCDYLRKKFAAMDEADKAKEKPK